MLNHHPFDTWNGGVNRDPIREVRPGVVKCDVRCIMFCYQPWDSMEDGAKTTPLIQGIGIVPKNMSKLVMTLYNVSYEVDRMDKMDKRPGVGPLLSILSILSIGYGTDI